MKYLHPGVISFVLLQFYSTHTVSADDYYYSCSPFAHYDGSLEDLECGSSMLPLSGPEVGGTVVQIENTRCHLRYDVEIFCRFRSDSFSQVFPGVLNMMWNVVECVSPFSGQSINVEVSYAAIRPNCTIEAATWITTTEEFLYYGDHAGVIAIDNSAPEDSKTSSRLFFTNTPVQIEWSADALHLSTFRDYIPDDFSRSSYTEVTEVTDIAVEILAYDNTKDSEEPPFQIIQSIELPPSYSTTTLIIDDETISAFMVDNWGSDEFRAAVIQVRVLALGYRGYYEGEYYKEARWILATRSSKLIGILPETTKDYGGECPFSFKEDCNFVDENNLQPCPPSTDIAQNDYSFSPDENCPWPSGNADCDPKVDLFDDYFNTCSMQSSYPTSVPAKNSKFLSGKPTDIPSLMPSPSKSPSSEPSVKSSNIPSVAPSKSPSGESTDVTSLLPTGMPSKSPFGEPSGPSEILTHIPPTARISFESTYLFDFRPWGLSYVAADINGDGLIDLIHVDWNDPNRLFINNGDGTFQDPTDLTGEDMLDTRVIIAADMDNDGYIDLVVGNNDDANGYPYSASQYLLLNKGDGTFDLPLTLPGGPSSTQDIAVADLNNDGYLDIVLANYWSDWGNKESRVLINNRDGTFDDSGILLGYGASVVTIADINGDGHNDIIMGYLYDPSELFINGGYGDFSNGSILLPNASTGTEAIAVMDVNNDELLDIIFGISFSVVDGYPTSGEPNEVLLNRGDGIFDESVTILPGGNFRTEIILAEDVNHDGYLDLVIGNENQPNQILLNKGDGTFDEAIELPGETSYGVTSVDINSDGMVDFVLGNGEFLIQTDPSISVPSFVPSDHPSSSPSTSPTSVPFFVPSDHPSSSPSTSPSTKCQEDLTGYEDWIDDNDGCRCDTFHPGAVGCYSNGQNQCCYARSGALITQYNDGSGRLKCYPKDSTRLETINNFLYDDLPFLYCCYLNDECESYYSGFFATPTDNGYVNPTISALTFGDPHISTFDDVDYQFHGYGEYVALCGNTEMSGPTQLVADCNPFGENPRNSEMISIHYRFAVLSEGRNGTATVGVAMKDGPLTFVVERNEDPDIRVNVYFNKQLVQFAPGRPRKHIVSGTTITKTSTRAPLLNVTISLPSGLDVVIIETGGVLNPSISRRTSTSFVGLLGQPDGDKGNEFTNSSNIILDISPDEGIFTPGQTEEIFYNFGQTWMIRNESDSFFNGDFSDYFFENFEPWFEVPSKIARKLQSEPEAQNERDGDDVCGDVEDEFIRQACIFDFAVKGDADLVSATTRIAIERETVNTILRNNPPEILNQGRNQYAQVIRNESSIFEIYTKDIDGDNITASIDRNDGDLFQLSQQISGHFNLYFNGTEKTGNFKAQVIVTDGKTPVLVTGTIQVTHSGKCSKKCAKKSSNKSSKKKTPAKKIKKNPEGII